MKVGSLFSGIGGFDLGLERAGIPVAWSCEIDKDARAVLAEHWPAVPCLPDVKEIDGGIPRVDVLCGGFPCQDLSVAGNRAGLAGERSGLFHEFMRIAGALAPDWVVIENVPGLLSSNDGRDMGTVLGTLADLGYGWAYRVLDAQFFGVAQRRRRVFIVGCSRGSAGAAAVLFESESCDGDTAPSRQAGTRVAGTLAACAGTGGLGGIGQSAASITSRLTEVRAAVSTLQGGGRRGSRIDAEGAGGGHLVAFSHTQGIDIQPSEDHWPTLRTEGGGMAVAAFFENQRGEPGQGYPAVREGMQVRRLTPLECERLQGFPAGWTACLSDSARYRTLGNAVAVPVAEWIGTQLLGYITTPARSAPTEGER